MPGDHFCYGEEISPKVKRVKIKTLRLKSEWNAVLQAWVQEECDWFRGRDAEPKAELNSVLGHDCTRSVRLDVIFSWVPLETVSPGTHWQTDRQTQTPNIPSSVCLESSSPREKDAKLVNASSSSSSIGFIVPKTMHDQLEEELVPSDNTT